MMNRQRSGQADKVSRDPAPLELIRLRTSQCHRELESCLDWPAAFSSASQYRQLLERFLCVVQPLDATIAQHLVSTPAGYDRQLRTASLLQDLEGLRSFLPGELPLASEPVQQRGYQPDLSYIVDEATAIGSLYVLEGSALGGQMLSRQVRAGQADWSRPASGETSTAFQRTDTYFAGRGAQTIDYWRGFCHWLNQRLDDEHRAHRAAEAANQTFTCFRTSLSGNTYA